MLRGMRKNKVYGGVTVVVVAFMFTACVGHSQRPIDAVRPAASPPSSAQVVPSVPPDPVPVETESVAPEPSDDHTYVPVPLPRGDDDHHRGWVHRKVCRHSIFC